MEPVKKTPLVSVIIVNWNGGEVLRQCLKSLSKIDYPKWELVMVDNGSVDGSVEQIKKLKIKNKNYNLKLKIFKNKTNLGFAVANNQGYKKSKGKYILLLNNDTKVTADFLSKLVGRMEKDNSIGVIQPKIFLMDNPGYLDNAGSFLTTIGFLEHWGFARRDGREFTKEKEIFSAKGACMLIRRDVIEKVGLFDEDFFSYFEESDFCWRVWLLGKRVIFYPEAEIYHKLGFTIRRLNVTSLNYHYYKNRISSLVKNLEVGSLLTILSLHLLISTGLAFAFILTLKPSGIIMIFKGIAWNIVNLPQTLTKRKEVDKLRRKKDHDIFAKVMHPVRLGKFLADFRRIEEDFDRVSS